MTNGTERPLPRIIQGGMGISISSWFLAQTVAKAGQMGVISGTAIERVVTCILQEGDPDGHMRRALARFPDQDMVREILATWYLPAGLTTAGVYRPVPMFSHKPNPKLQALAVVCSFVEVTLAKEGHTGEIGMNLLAKIQAPTLPVLYGAMLAGVDWILMGAGIPRDLPGQVSALANHEVCVQKLDVSDGSHLDLPFDPHGIGLSEHMFAEPLPKPRCMAIVSSDVLATSLVRSGGFSGFVVENWQAGGHNAPPRGSGKAAVERPVYGPRDQANLEKMRALAVPFWLAGGHASCTSLRDAEAQGAVGVQVGTAFAFCRESGMEPVAKAEALHAALHAGVEVVTEGLASPTGFPFKVARIAGTEGMRSGDERPRQPCVMGYLRHAVRGPDDSITWRCPAEPTRDWERKGGDIGETVGRRCVCQGLFATAGHAHATEAGGLELSLVTAGDDLASLRRYIPEGETTYGAHDVLAVLLSSSPATPVP
jgi:nitronate monooxygenase